MSDETSDPPAALPTVLVVEDETLLRLLAAGALEEAGFKVVEAADAIEALELMTMHPEIRVLFTDVKMPGHFDGVDLAQLVHKRWPEVVLLITSGGVPPVEEKISEESHFIAKPYTTEELIDTIKENLK
jgi:two-component system, response regulator PdtaR